MVDTLLDATRELEEIIEEGKAKIEGGVHLALCNAALKIFKAAKFVEKNASFANATNVEEDGEEDGEESEEGEEGEEDENENDQEVSEQEEEEEEEESDPEPEERTEEDMGVNELAELWGWNFDFGRPGATLELEGLIWTIVEDTEAKRVCAAVRVLNGALKGSKPDDPADAERILEWKEELVAQRAIRVCSEILEGVDVRGFLNEDDEEHWLYSIICDEILELFQRLGDGDALFRTKLRRNGALKGVKDYHARGKGHTTEYVLDMLQQ